MISEEKINTNRQIELDIAKGLAILFMITVHVLWDLSTPEVKNTILGNLIYFLGGIPAAPVFMFAMGIGIVYSKKESYSYFLKRGVILIIVGYLLNAIRGFIPLFLGLELNLLDVESIKYGNLLMNLLEIDILHFAGLSLIVIAFIKKSKISILGYLIIALFFTTINVFVTNISSNNVIINSILGLFWGSGINSYFPLLSWIFYPLSGALFGYFLIRCKNKNRFYLYVLLLSLVILLNTALITGYVDFGFEDEYNYYHHDVRGNLYFTSMVMIWISLLYYINKFTPQVIKNKLISWSRNITKIYIIHWIIIGWSILLLGYNNLTFWQSIIYMLGLIIITDRLAKYITEKFNIKL